MYSVIKLLPLQHWGSCRCSQAVCVLNSDWILTINTLDCICEILSFFIQNQLLEKQAHPWTASPTPWRSPSARRWGPTGRRTRPSERLSPGRRWPGLLKHPGPRKCHKDHLNTKKKQHIIKTQLSTLTFLCVISDVQKQALC